MGIADFGCAGERRFSSAPTCALLTISWPTFPKLHDIPVLIEFEIGLKEYPFLITEVQAQSSPQMTWPLNGPGDISFRTKTTEVQEIVRENVQLQIASQWQGWLAGFRGLCPEETRSLACWSLGLEIELGKVEVEACEVDFWKE